MKDVKSLGVTNVSTSCDTDDKLLTVRDREYNEEVMEHSLGKSSLKFRF